ncbi:MAG TPA: hypothetical protein PKD45_11280 [Flavobacteriales bacterium]|nr:hypothetical protein [Flavobacteriales bacterium]
MRAIFFLFLGLLGPAAMAQVNGKGAVQLGVGINMGAHATLFESEITVLGFTKKFSDHDGALTLTVPLEVQVGLADRVSLGLYLEPGSYVDSAGTHPNKLLLLGMSVRYYVVNKERGGVYLNADLGTTSLEISDVGSAWNQSKYTDRYEGGHVRLGVGGLYFLGNTFGLHGGIRYVAVNFRWKGRTPRDPMLDALNYKANLKTSGALLELGMQLKF